MLSTTPTLDGRKRKRMAWPTIAERLLPSSTLFDTATFCKILTHNPRCIRLLRRLIPRPYARRDLFIPLSRRNPTLPPTAQWAERRRRLDRLLQRRLRDFLPLR